MADCRRPWRVVPARGRRGTRRWFYCRLRFRSPLFEQTFLVELSERAHVDIIFEFQGFAFDLFAELFHHRLNAGWSGERTAIEHLHATLQRIIYGFSVIGSKRCADDDL